MKSSIGSHSDFSYSGFTVLQMAIVLVVIGILLGIGIPKYANLRDTASYAAAKENVDALRDTASMYYSKKAIETGTGIYPADKEELEALLEKEVVWGEGYGYTYDPSTGGVTLIVPDEGGGGGCDGG